MAEFHTQQTLMAIGAHHDDNELVAGTLALHASAGWRIVSVVMTDGCWIRGRASPDHVAIREAESLAAAKLLGIETAFLRLPEGNLECASLAQRNAVIELLRQHRPHLVITHPPRDYHADHEATSRIVEQAVMQCHNACVATSAPPCSVPPLLYYSDAWFVPFEPDEYVDVGGHMDLKLRMLECHRSQLPADGISQEGDMLDLARLQSRVRGVEAGVRYAEAFRIAPGIGRVRRSCLLLGQR